MTGRCCNPDKPPFELCPNCLAIEVARYEEGKRLRGTPHEPQSEAEVAALWSAVRRVADVLQGGCQQPQG